MAENNEKKSGIELEENEILRVSVKKIVEDENPHMEIMCCVSQDGENAPLIREALLQLCRQMGVMPGFTICFPNYSASEGKSDSEENNE